MIQTAWGRLGKCVKRRTYLIGILASLAVDRVGDRPSLNTVHLQILLLCSG